MYQLASGVQDNIKKFKPISPRSILPMNYKLRLAKPVGPHFPDVNASAQTAKELKAQLKELTEKKKEVGKSPRKSQAVSNKFTIPIPKIRGSSTTTTMTNAVFEHNPNDNNLSQAVFPSPVQPPSPVPGLGDAGDAPTMTGVMAPGPGPYINSAESEEDYDHPGFHLPPLDLDLFCSDASAIPA